MSWALYSINVPILAVDAEASGLNAVGRSLQPDKYNRQGEV